MNSIFYIFSSLALICGYFVIQAKNPVHSVLFLILVFLNATGLLILLGLDFFALVFLVIYVGAITTLFLFVVMMLNIKLTEINEKRLRYLPVGALLGFLFLIQIFLIMDNEFISGAADATERVAFFKEIIEPISRGLKENAPYSFFSGIPNDQQIYSGVLPQLNNHLGDASHRMPVYYNWASSLKTASNIEAIGCVIYTYFFYAFILASIVLLVAMIGSIVLTMEKSSFVRRQNTYEQNAREYKKTIRMVTPMVEAIKT